MIKAEWLFWLVALYFAIVAVLRLRDRTDAKRFGSAAFWGILAFAFVYATFVVDKTGSALVEGIAVLALAAPAFAQDHSGHTMPGMAAPAKPKASFIRPSTGGITSEPAMTPMISATCCFQGVASTSWPVFRSCKLSFEIVAMPKTTPVTISA